MPLTQASLSSRIVAAMTAEKGAPADPAELQKFADAIAKAVVDEITQNGLVTGVVSGGGSSGGQPITGTVT